VTGRASAGQAESRLRARSQSGALRRASPTEISTIPP
jgi:hypothetical protein